MIDRKDGAFDWVIKTWGPRSASERLILIYMAEHSERNGAGFVVSPKTYTEISEWSGVSRRHVHHSIMRLCEDNVISRERQRGDRGAAWAYRFGA